MVRHGVEQGLALSGALELAPAPETAHSGLDRVSLFRRALVSAALATPLYLAGCGLLLVGLPTSEAGSGDVRLYERVARLVGDAKLPYRDFFLEYPPGSLLVLLPPGALPGSYGDAFKALMVLAGLAMLVAASAALAAVRAPRRRAALALAAIGVAPVALGPLLLDRYDVWPALLAAGGAAALLAGMPRTAFAALGLAAAAKLFAVAALPVAGVAVWRRFGARVLVQSAASFAAAALVVWLPFAALAPGGVAHSLRVHLERGLQIESVGSSLLLAADRLGLYVSTDALAPPGSRELVGALPDAAAVLSSVLQAAAALAVAVAFARGPATGERLLLGLAGAVVGFVAFGKVLSPQYLVWLVPLVPLVRSRLAGPLLVVALALTQVEFTRSQDVAEVGPEVWVLLARDALLVVLYGFLVARLASTSVASAARSAWR